MIGQTESVDPPPEGAHRDGVDFVAVILMQRRGVRGGETRVTEPDGSSAGCFTLDDPGSMLLMDDARVIHETSPILPTTASGIRYPRYARADLPGKWVPDPAVDDSYRSTWHRSRLSRSLVGSTSRRGGSHNGKQ